MDFVYDFGSLEADAEEEDLRDLLGGKGLRLSQMTSAGLPVPSGFTIATQASKEYLRTKAWPPGLRGEVNQHLSALLNRVQQLRADDPLHHSVSPVLLSVRSGPPASMPGMLDTITNIGLTASDVLSEPDPLEAHFLFDCYQRFIVSYSTKVPASPPKQLDREEKLSERLERVRKQLVDEKRPADLETGQLEGLIYTYSNILQEYGLAIPDSLEEQVYGAITAVFESWNGDRAREFRRRSSIRWRGRIPDDLGTAVNIQLMVFGNRNDSSGSGVAYSRDPVTGEPGASGEFLLNAQGEDIVGGRFDVQPLAVLAGYPHLVPVHDELVAILRQLERTYRDACEVEFTFENERLWILQSRVALRSGKAAIKIARAMAEEPFSETETFLTPRRAVQRISPEDVMRALHPTLLSRGEQPVATGISVSPGAVVGKAAFRPDDALEMAKHDKVVLIMDYITSQDIGVIEAVSGIVTLRRGFTSHSMVLARSWGKPCIAGVSGRIVDAGRRLILGLPGSPPKGISPPIIRKGDMLSLDATTGHLFHGPIELQTEIVEPPDFRAFMTWTDGFRPPGFQIRANVEGHEEVVDAIRQGADGIGIVRTERLLARLDKLKLLEDLTEALTDERETHDLQKELRIVFANEFEAMFRGLEQRRERLPIAVRLLDWLIPEDRQLSSRKQPRAGVELRGVRIGIVFPDIYRLQIQALLDAVKRFPYGNEPVLEIIVPFVVDPAELDRVKGMVEHCIQECRRERAIDESWQVFVGPMMETPRALVLADKFASRADFLSYGTNDLTDLVLGLNGRDFVIPKYVEDGIIPNNPLEALDPYVAQFVIDSCKLARDQGSKAIRLCTASEHAHDVQSVKLFLQQGFEYVSCIPRFLPIARLAVAKAQIEIDDEGLLTERDDRLS